MFISGKILKGIESFLKNRTQKVLISLPSDDKRLQLTTAVKLMALITSEDVMRSFGCTSNRKCALVMYYCWPSNAHYLVVVRPEFRIIASEVYTAMTLAADVGYTLLSS